MRFNPNCNLFVTIGRTNFCHRCHSLHAKVSNLDQNSLEKPCRLQPCAYMIDRMQLQRWELKYVVPEATALRIRDCVGSYLELDEFGMSQPDLSYSVHSLYLDSVDLRIYWGTINGNKNRYKLRLRFYDDQPQAPIFFEIKRRMNDAILKQRGGVKRESVEAILGGSSPGWEDLSSVEAKSLSAVKNFVKLMLHDDATPRAHVCYRREAWICSTDSSVRVTFDRQVRCAPEFTTRLTAELDHPVEVFGNLVVLELKFTGRFPAWFNHLVQRFGLKQGSAAKYADGVALRGEHYFTHQHAAMLGERDALDVRDQRLASLEEAEVAPIHI